MVLGARSSKQSFAEVRSRAEPGNKLNRPNPLPLSRVAGEGSDESQPAKRLANRAMFWPPKPKLLVRIVSHLASRAVLGT